MKYRPLDLPVQQDSKGNRQCLCNHKAKPDHRQIIQERAGQQDWNQQNYLPHKCEVHAVIPVPKPLEYGSKNDTDAGHKEAEGHDSDSGNTKLQHLFRRIKQQQDFIRNHFHDNENYRHDNHREDKGAPYGLMDPLLLLRPIIVCDNRDQAVVHSPHTDLRNVLYF